LQPVDRVDDRLEFPLDQEIDRSLTAKFGVPGVQPDLDTLRTVDLLKLPNNVVDIDKAIAGLSGWLRGPGGPVLHLTFSNTRDRPNLSGGKTAAAELLDQGRIRDARGPSFRAHNHHL